MSEKPEHPRDAGKIIAYCNEATPDWRVDPYERELYVEVNERDMVAHFSASWLGEEAGQANARFAAQARTDLPAVTKAAVELRRIAEASRDIVASRALPSSLIIIDDVLERTKWLEDGE